MKVCIVELRRLDLDKIKFALELECGMSVLSASKPFFTKPFYSLGVENTFDYVRPGVNNALKILDLICFRTKE